MTRKTLIATAAAIFAAGTFACYALFLGRVLGVDGLD